MSALHTSRRTGRCPAGATGARGSGCGVPSKRRADKPGGGKSGSAACRGAVGAPCVLSAWTTRTVPRPRRSCTAASTAPGSAQTRLYRAASTAPGSASTAPGSLRFASGLWAGLRPRVQRSRGLGVRCGGSFRVGGCRPSSLPLMSSHRSERILPTMTPRHASPSMQPAISTSARLSESSAWAILRPHGTPASRSRRQSRSSTWQDIAARALLRRQGGARLAGAEERERMGGKAVKKSFARILLRLTEHLRLRVATFHEFTDRTRFFRRTCVVIRARLRP